MKKLLALILALMMVFGTVSALAGDDDNPDPVVTDPPTTAGLGTDAATEPGVYEGHATTLKINKAVVIENAVGNIEVAYPQFTFTYAITKADPAGASINDGTYQAAVQMGKDNGFNPMTASVTIASDEVTLNNNGQQVALGEATLNVVPANHDAPGIYRYMIHESSNNLASVGGVRKGNASRDYYMDVYIGWKDGTTDAQKIAENHGDYLEVVGFVLINKNESITTETADNDKESGFDEIPTNSEGKLAGDADKIEDNNDFFHTFNMVLTKKVEGTMGDTAHPFPFKVTVANEGLAYTYQVATETSVPTTTNGTSGTAVETTIAHNKEFKIYGLSPKAIVEYQEKNDTVSEYTVTTSSGKKLDGTALADVSADYSDKTADTVGKEDTVTLSDLVASDYGITNKTSSDLQNADYTAQNATITFTNRLDSISPTGVVLRFAPYFAMFAAGLALFIIFATKRSKKEEE